MSVETSEAPAWLQQLEERRQKRTTKLTQDLGAGSPCLACSSCSGLDLHFWRKICRNCKCRKDLHDIPQDEQDIGWLQFEILGAVRSKPAFIKLSAQETPVKLDWVPPNVEPDLASQYMDTLLPENVPVAGSEAANKRKQQLEWQMPAHDLDPNLCHNLSEKEAEQLQKYVDKLREDCVGQGNVVRVGNAGEKRVVPMTRPVEAKVQRDKFVDAIMASEEVRAPKGGALIVFSAPLVPDFKDKTQLSDKSKYKLNAMRLNSDALQSALRNWDFYANLLNDMEAKGVNIDQDTVLAPIKGFQKEYLASEKFQKEVDTLLEPTFQSPAKIRPPQVKHEALLTQETPARRLQTNKFDDLVNPETGQILIPSIQKDRVLSNILTSELVQGILHDPAYPLTSTPLIVSARAMVPDFEDAPHLSDLGRARLEAMRINTAGVQSGVEHGEVYDRIFRNLKRRKINYSFDPVLQPIQELREEMEESEPFRAEIVRFVSTLPQFSSSEPYQPEVTPQFAQQLPSSKSSDSGLGASSPPTPNYATYPGALPAELEALKLSPEPPRALFKCKECTGAIYTGDVAVKAERAGREVVWHPACFRCSKCQELLADLVYFYHAGSVYCARDLAEILKIPRCAACDELIFTKEYTAAEGATFHIKHFCCFHCDSPLAGQEYVPDDKTGQPLCLACYDTFYADQCQRCGHKIKPNEQGVAWGSIHWHGECFRCAGRDCDTSLIGGRFCVKENRPFCSASCVRSVLSA